LEESWVDGERRKEYAVTSSRKVDKVTGDSRRTTQEKWKAGPVDRSSANKSQPNSVRAKFGHTDAKGQRRRPTATAAKQNWKSWSKGLGNGAKEEQPAEAEAEKFPNLVDRPLSGHPIPSQFPLPTGTVSSSWNLILTLGSVLSPLFVAPATDNHHPKQGQLAAELKSAPGKLHPENSTPLSLQGYASMATH